MHTTVDRTLTALLGAARVADRDLFYHILGDGLCRILDSQQVELHAAMPAADVFRRRWPSEEGPALAVTPEQAGMLSRGPTDACPTEGGLLLSIHHDGYLQAVARLADAGFEEKKLLAAGELLTQTGELMHLLLSRQLEQRLLPHRARLEAPATLPGQLTAWTEVLAELVGSEQSYLAALLPDETLGAPDWLTVIGRHGSEANEFLDRLPRTFVVIQETLDGLLPVAIDGLQSPDWRRVRGGAVRDSYRDLEGRFKSDKVFGFVDFLRQLESCVLLPLALRQEAAGVLAFHSKKPAHFAPEDVFQVLLAARQLAPLLAQKKAQANEALSDREAASGETGALGGGCNPDLDSRTGGVRRRLPGQITLSRSELWKQLVKDVLRISGADRAALVLLLCGDADGLKVVCSLPDERWAPRDNIRVLQFSEETACVETFRRGKPYAVSDLRARGVVYRQQEDPLLGYDPTLSTLALPVKLGGKRLGVLEVDYYRPGAFDADLVQRLEELVDDYAPLLGSQGFEQVFDELRQLLQGGAPLDWQQILSVVAHLVDATAGSLFVEPQDDVGRFRLVASMKTPDLLTAGQSSYERGEVQNGLMTKTGWVLKENKGLMVDNLLPESLPSLACQGKVPDLQDADEDRRSPLLLVPLAVDQEVFGVVRLRREAERVFQGLDLYLVTAAAQMIAGRLERDRSQHCMRVFDELLASLASIRDARQLAKKATDAFRLIFGNDSDVAIRRVEEHAVAGGEPGLVLEYWSSDDLLPIAPPVMQRGQNGAGYVWESGKPLYVEDMGEDANPNAQRLFPLWRKSGWTSFQVPVCFGDEVKGTFTVRKGVRDAFSEPLRSFLVQMASVIVVAYIRLREDEQERCRTLLLEQLTDYGFRFDPNKDLHTQQRDLHCKLLAHMADLLEPLHGWVAVTNPDSGCLEPYSGNNEVCTTYLDGEICKRVPTPKAELALRLLPNNAGLYRLNELPEGEVKAELQSMLHLLADSQKLTPTEENCLCLPLRSAHALRAVFLFVLRPQTPVHHPFLKMIQETLGKAAELLGRLDELSYNRQMAPLRRALQLIGNAAIQMEHHLRKPVTRMRTNFGDMLLALRSVGVKDAPVSEEPGKQRIGRLRRNLELIVAQENGLPALEDLLFYLIALKEDVEILDRETRSFIDGARTYHLGFGPVDLLEVMRQAACAFGTDSPIHFHLDGLNGPLEVEGNCDLLVKAVVELCRNGLNALDKESGQGRVDVHLDVAESEYRLYIRDNGCGMTAEEQRRAFLPFVSIRGGGKGLGLPSAANIIEAHGGGLSLQSQPGETLFTIALPRRRKP